MSATQKFPVGVRSVVDKLPAVPMLQPKTNTYDASMEEDDYIMDDEGTQNPMNPNDESNFNQGKEEVMNMDAMGDEEADPLMEQQPFECIPMVSQTHFEDLPQDEDGDYILIPTVKCLVKNPDMLYQPSYKNWGDVKRIVVIFVALILVGVFGWQAPPVFVAAFAVPALLWQPLLLIIFCVLVPFILINRALWPNLYYRVTSKTIFVVKKYAFALGGRDMIMLNVNDVLAVEMKSSFSMPCGAVKNKGTITFHTLHAVHPELVFSILGAFDAYFVIRDFLENHLNKVSKMSTAPLYPVGDEGDKGLADSICGAICCCERNRYNITKLHATKMKRACCNVFLTNVFMERVFDISMDQNFLQAGKAWNDCCKCYCWLYCCCICKKCGNKDTPDTLSDAFPRYSGSITLHHLRQSPKNPDQYRHFILNVPGCKEVIYRFGSDIEYQRSMQHAFRIKNLTRTAKLYGIGQSGMSMLHK